jgi:hypothetical protein
MLGIRINSLPWIYRYSRFIGIGFQAFLGNTFNALHGFIRNLVSHELDSKHFLGKGFNVLPWI